MGYIGTIRLTRRSDRLPEGFVLTNARLDLLIALNIPYYKCIIGWGKIARKRLEPIYKYAINQVYVERVQGILTYRVRV